MKRRLLFAASATLAFAGSAEAQPAAQPPAAVAPADLVLARAIVAVMLPADRRGELMRSVMASLTGPMSAALLRSVPDDPGLRAIVQRYIADMPNILLPALQAKFPLQAEAMARAYARMFTHDELVAIDGFARTPAGAKYLSRSTQILQDPDVVAVNTQIANAAHDAATRAAPRLQQQIIEYLTAHPDVAKRFGAAQKPG